MSSKIDIGRKGVFDPGLYLNTNGALSISVCSELKGKMRNVPSTSATACTSGQLCS